MAEVKREAERPRDSGVNGGGLLSLGFDMEVIVTLSCSDVQTEGRDGWICDEQHEQL